MVARKPIVPYYADAIWYPISKKTNYGDLLEIVKTGVNHVYIDFTTATFAPKLEFLLDPERIPPELTPIIWHKNCETCKYHVVLFEVSHVTTMNHISMIKT